MTFRRFAFAVLLAPLAAEPAWSQPDCQSLTRTFAPLRDRVLKLNSQIVTTAASPDGTNQKLCPLFQNYVPVLKQEADLRKTAEAMGCTLEGPSAAKIDDMIEHHTRYLASKWCQNHIGGR